jgi:hypothetical protein
MYQPLPPSDGGGQVYARAAVGTPLRFHAPATGRILTVADVQFGLFWTRLVIYRLR